MKQLIFTVIFFGGSVCLAQDTSKTAPADKHEQFIKSRTTTPGQLRVDYMKLRTQELVRDNSELSLAAIVQTPEEDLPAGSRLVNGPSQYDSRVELRSLDPSQPWVKKIIGNAYSVAVIVNRYKIRKVSKSFYVIDDSNTLGSIYQLCPGEAFRNEPVIGTGTAVVTGKRTLLTAAHVFNAPPEQYAVIFGYEVINQTGAFQKIIPADSIYFPVKIERQSADLDIALFTVDRDIKAAPLKWSENPNPAINEKVYMIGFPYGLPKKVAANASVQANNDAYSIYTTLDAFQGNSGSPVFDLQTNEVIGILVSGGVDYHWNGTCNVSTICSIPYCQGEKAVRITAIKSLLNYGN